MREREPSTLRRALSNVAGHVANRLGGDRFLAFVHGKLGTWGAPHNPVQVLDNEGIIIGNGIITKTDVPRGILTIELEPGKNVTVRGSRVIS